MNQEVVMVNVEQNKTDTCRWATQQSLRLIILLIVSIVILSTPSLYAKEAVQGVILGTKISEHPAWFKESFLDISEDVAEASESNKHVMLFLHLNGCPYCFKMNEENLKNAPYTNFIKTNFDVIALNIKGDREVAVNDETSLTEKELAEQLKVIYTPTIIFMDSNNKIVARTDGYRSVEDFKVVLDYVHERAYKNSTLTQYINNKKSPQYQFRSHPLLSETNDLTSLGNGPIAILFEDKGCRDCTLLHDGHLSNPGVNDTLKQFNFIRLDAMSSQKLIDMNGKTTTPRQYAEQLGLSYRPSILLFNQGKEIMRIESRLFLFHFSEALRYVGESHYKKYPKSFYDYLDIKTAELLKSGKNVNLAE